MKNTEIAPSYLDHEIAEARMVHYLGFKSGPYIESHHTSEKVRFELVGRDAKQIST